jgi:phage FluMu protein Com
MARRGRCRCGTILLFERTAQGYKTRCPECKSVVRLRPRAKAARSTLPVPAGAPAEAGPFHFDAPAGPPPLVEVEVYREPPRRQLAAWPFLLLGGVALAVVALIAAVVMLCF